MFSLVELLFNILNYFNQTRNCKEFDFKTAFHGSCWLYSTWKFTHNSTNRCGVRRATCCRTTWVLKVQAPSLRALESNSIGMGFRVLHFNKHWNQNHCYVLYCTVSDLMCILIKCMLWFCRSEISALPTTFQVMLKLWYLDHTLSSKNL